MGAATKVCRDCRLEKPLDAFPLQKGGRLGRHPLCKPCRAAQERSRYERDRERILARMRNDEARRRRTRWRSIERKYGLARHEYEALFAAQRGCCAICGIRPPLLVVDHCHLTGQVRSAASCAVRATARWGTCATRLGCAWLPPSILAGPRDRGLERCRSMADRTRLLIE